MKTSFEKKKEKLYNLYDRFERETMSFRRQAVCRAGCSFCCTFMGNIDILTLEGLIVLEHIDCQPAEFQGVLKKRIAENRTGKENDLKPPCPFLQDDHTCRIYAIRPFSCRQLYSVRECGDSGPVAHRQAVESSRATVREMQRLDDTGYSGHISYILHLFDDPAFRTFYLSGGFAPEQIMKFGKAHGLTINRLAKQP